MLTIRTINPRLCCLFAGFWLAACTTDQAALPDAPMTPVKQSITSAPSMDPIAGPSAPAQDGGVMASRTTEPQPAGKALQEPAESVRRSPASPPVPAPKKKPAPVFDLKKLVGMDQRELGNLLGKPSLLRGEQDAQVWQYGGASCVLHVFLYRDGAKGSYRVVYADAVSRHRRTAIQASDASFQQTCLSPIPHWTTAQSQPR